MTEQGRDICWNATDMRREMCRKLTKSRWKKKRKINPSDVQKTGLLAAARNCVFSPLDSIFRGAFSGLSSLSQLSSFSAWSCVARSSFSKGWGRNPSWRGEGRGREGREKYRETDSHFGNLQMSSLYDRQSPILRDGMFKRDLGWF